MESRTMVPTPPQDGPPSSRRTPLDVAMTADDGLSKSLVSHLYSGGKRNSKGKVERPASNSLGATEHVPHPPDMTSTALSASLAGRAPKKGQQSVAALKQMFDGTTTLPKTARVASRQRQAVDVKDPAVPLTSRTNATSPPLSAMKFIPAPPAATTSRRGREDGEESDAVVPFIRAMQRGEKCVDKFIYLLMRNQGPKEPYNPYDLKVVKHSVVETTSPSNYFTISSTGITHYRNDDGVFLSLEEWMKEYEIFHSMTRIPFFRKYRRWKTFCFWKKFVRHTVITAYKEHLEDTLFILNRNLSPSLIQIRSTCVKIQDLQLYDNFTETRTLSDFQSRQTKQCEHTSRKLESITSYIRDTIEGACKAAMQDSAPRPLVTDSIDLSPRTTRTKRDATAMQMQPAAEPEKHSYIEQSQRRAVCRRLTAFIRLCDYMVSDSLVILAAKSIGELKLSILYPSPERVLLRQQQEKAKQASNTLNMAGLAERQPPKPTVFCGPVFFINLLLENDEICLSPRLADFTDGTDSVINGFIDVISGVSRFLKAPQFIEYTRNGGSDQPGDEPGNGPEMREMVERRDEHPAELASIRLSHEKAFAEAEQYAASFGDFRLMHLANQKMRRNEIKEADQPLDWFRDEMHRLKQQSEGIDGIPLENEVAVYVVKSDGLRTKLEPGPRRCLQMLQELLPEMAKEKNLALLQKLQDANKRLTTVPTSIEDFVEFDTFHGQVSEQVDTFRMEFDNIRDMYREMDIEEPRIEYSKQDSLMFFEGTRPEFDKLSNLVASIEEQKEGLRRDFADKIDSELVGLRGKLEGLQERACDPMIEDETEDIDNVIAYVKGLMKEIDEIKQREKDLLSYQEGFQVTEANPIDEISEVHRDISDKLRLWTSLKDWQSLTKTWEETVFAKLDAPAIEAEVNKYDKTVKQVDRTLKGNPVVPKLRGMVEAFRLTMPVIICLKNPDLKEHHWQIIDDILCRDLSKDPNSWTLGVLLELNAMDLREEIGRVSYQATQEQQLNEMLNGVIQKWVGIEFSVNQHKDQKDTYVLGAVDDIIEQMEDSMVLISTIATNRYCSGVLRQRVERWESDLKYMQECLDKWLEVQRKWMYLESIFSNVELQRQWADDARNFLAVDKVFRELMRRAHDNPNVRSTLLMNSSTLLGQFRKDIEALEWIEKRLEEKLELKRRLFPRFYFLSNDDLLDILAQIKNPEKIAPHTLKMFDGVKYFSLTESADLTHMNSVEGEKVAVVKPVKARGPVEKWLLEAEAVMIQTLRRAAKVCVDDYEARPRTKWMFEHPVQLVLTVSMIFWQKAVTHALRDEDTAHEKLVAFKELVYSQLRDLAAVTGQDLSKVGRRMLSTLILLDVHGRDLVNDMIEAKVAKVGQFGWTKQLRCYWEQDSEGVGDIYIRQNTSEFTYGYEYLGAQGRLVITPLTDRIFMTITGALHLCLGASPSGPAGTGKTESVKDLAKGLGRLCIVYNCSDGVTYKMMEKFFSGLCQTGAWCCLDEFNRINIEVLSVVAQQLMEVREALLQQKADPSIRSFNFQGTSNVELKHTFGCFITMNPGYAGRTELPDNLKALFRPVAAMTPDFRMIAEVIFYSEGFANAEALSLKITQLYKLSSEQLSPQHHYDFGMRALKSILVMAGDLKRSQPDVDEDLTLIIACNDANIPKFVAEDIPLFNGIMSDLFPGVTIPQRSYPELLPAIEDDMDSKVLQKVPAYITKVIQLYETLIVRHGVMMVGAAGGGKTEGRNILANALTAMHEAGSTNPQAQVVNQYLINPKSISMGELYGSVDPNTNEWQDGIMPIIVKQNRVDADAGSTSHEWIIFDGPVDTLWVESMNSVLDDSKLLCLDNGVRIKLPDTVHLMFEVADLAVASPATVSRCGMVYLDSTELGWEPIVRSWGLTKMAGLLGPRGITYLCDLMIAKLEKGTAWLFANGKQLINQSRAQVADSCCSLFHALCTTKGITFPEENPAVENDADDPLTGLRNEMLHVILAFCFIWSVGGNLDNYTQELFDIAARDMLEDLASFSGPHTVYDMQVDFANRRFVTWEQDVPDFHYNPSMPYFDIIVPTVDTHRYSYLLSTLVKAGKPTLFSGQTGTGKSIMVQSTMKACQDEAHLITVTMQFSAKTSSPRTQDMIESKLKAKRKNILGAPMVDGHQMRVALFIDDLNMPALEQFGASPPVELVRQMMSNGGFYDRKQLFWKKVQDVVVLSACGPPEGGRSPVTPRLTRLFYLLQVPNLSVESMKKIFGQIVSGFFASQNFHKDVKALVGALVSGSIDVYLAIKEHLRPRPMTAHYTFNLRDLSKVFQGIMQVNPRTCPNTTQAARLWIHENQRCFYDRLINDEDRQVYTEEIAYRALCQYFPGQWDHDELFRTNPIVWGDFLVLGALPEEKRYEEATDTSRLPNLFSSYLDEYNIAMNRNLNLVFFTDHCYHLARIIRCIRQPRGNALLVGVGGSGKQTLTRLAASIAECQLFQIEVDGKYSLDRFHEDLLELYQIAGIECKQVVFLLNDSQIVNEGMAEDVNNMLNSGEIPSLFSPEERDKKINASLQAAQEAGRGGSRDDVFAYFISCVRDNLHCVLCMSPVGDAFRTRCRNFPSLTNCCNIDWFDKWPTEALHQVAQRQLGECDFGDSDASAALREKLEKMCVDIHQSVSSMAERFYAEIRRRFYVTPTSYLEFLTLYLTLLDDKRRELGEQLHKVRNGKNKMNETTDFIALKQAEIKEMRPILEERSIENEKMMKEIEERKEKAAVVRVTVSAQENDASKKAAEASAIQLSAQEDLNQAMPALNDAVRALELIDKKDINEMKAYTAPPAAVEKTMNAVLILLRKPKYDWKLAKEVMSDSNFIQLLKNYDRDSLDEGTIKKLGKFYDDPDFVPDKIGSQGSAACKSLCMWCRALHIYYYVAKEVEPKKAKLAEAQAELAATNAKLAEAQAALKAVEEEMATLQASFDKSVKNKEELEFKLDQAQRHLATAEVLTDSLGTEVVRWDEMISRFDKDMLALPANVFLSAASIAYFGPFTPAFRAELVGSWVAQAKELDLGISDEYSLVRTLGDPMQVREWQIMSLPSDQTSTENAILVKVGTDEGMKVRRWPLMIDPQGQANKWIRKMEGKNGLKVVKLSDPKYLQVMKSAIQNGTPLLIDDLGETLDPAMDSVLTKQVYSPASAPSQLYINLGGSENAIHYEQSFRLYMTTKIANPHYLPEICIKVTLINFTVTMEGLEDQMLGDVVSIEKAELEDQKNKIVKSVADDKRKLKRYEDLILSELEDAKGNILENQKLIDTLKQAQSTSELLSKRVVEAEEKAQIINEARETYRPVAARAATLYFVMADLPNIDPMYQYSLEYFKKLVANVVKQCPSHNTFDEHLDGLQGGITEATYLAVCRGLMNAHKVVFSLLMCSAVKRAEGGISHEEWTYFNRASALVRSDVPEKPPTCSFVSDQAWGMLDALEINVPAWQGLLKDIAARPALWAEWFAEKEPQKRDVPNGTGGGMDWAARLSKFQKALLLRACREEKVLFAMLSYISEEMGDLYITSPPIDLQRALNDSSYHTPVIFILSAGSDPTDGFIKWVEEKHGRKVKSISLGQGQEKPARQLIDTGKKAGDWVLLQNCHLGRSFMPGLQDIIASLEGDKQAKDDFRLFLTSMPASYFPVPVLQNSIKLTNEAPSGIKANLLRCYTTLKDDDVCYFDEVGKHKAFPECEKGRAYKRLLFNLCFFHSLVLERKKFGPLGWNVKYEWNDTDINTSLTWLRLFINDNDEIPWDSMLYIIGEINYGGRMTDPIDRRCLHSVLRRFFTVDALSESFEISSSGTYPMPSDGDLAHYLSAIQNFPVIDEPEVFGLHENASLRFQLQESHALLKTVLSVQPRATGKGGGVSPEEQVKKKGAELQTILPAELEFEEAGPFSFTKMENGLPNSLSTVLGHEVERFRKMQRVINSTLKELGKALAGLTVLSEALDGMFQDFLTDTVPQLWSEVAYPSLKPLGSWIKDFVARIEHCREWLRSGPPPTFWLPGLYSPHGFMTGVLQGYARQFTISVDVLSFSFQLLDMESGEVEEGPSSGVYVHGLFADSWMWNREAREMEDSLPGENYSSLPVIYLLPEADHKVMTHSYRAPMYITTVRKGTITSLGASSNFILFVEVPTSRPEDYWIQMGSAIVCQLND